MDIIGDTWGFSGKTPIAPSGGFSVETLTGATPSWKTELNRSISAMEDGISGGLQHRHKTCCEKGGRRGRRACMVQRWHHRRDAVFRIGRLAYNIWQRNAGQRRKRGKQGNISNVMKKDTLPRIAKGSNQ